MAETDAYDPHHEESFEEFTARYVGFDNSAGMRMRRRARVGRRRIEEDMRYRESDRIYLVKRTGMREQYYIREFGCRSLRVNVEDRR